MFIETYFLGEKHFFVPFVIIVETQIPRSKVHAPTLNPLVYFSLRTHFQKITWTRWIFFRGSAGYSCVNEKSFVVSSLFGRLCCNLSFVCRHDKYIVVPITQVIRLQAVCAQHPGLVQPQTPSISMHGNYSIQSHDTDWQQGLRGWQRLLFVSRCSHIWLTI